MSKLKLGPLADDRPVKLSVELPAAVHRDLQAYAAALAAETGGSPAGAPRNRMSARKSNQPSRAPWALTKSR